MKIIEVSVRRRVTVSMVTLAVMLFGAVAFNRLEVTLLPDLNYPTLTVRTEYPGAAPVEVETLITEPIEEAVGVVKNLVQIRSISRSGQSDVVLEFEWGTDMDFAGLDVREKLDALNLPLESEKPVILRFDPALDPILTMALSQRRPQDSTPEPDYRKISNDGLGAGNGLKASELRLKYLRVLAEEQLKKELESLPGVAAVKMSGGLEEEIQIEVDQSKLAQLDLTIDEVAARLRQENVNLAGGSLEEGANRYLVRTLNQFKTVDDMRNVVLRSRGGSKIYLKDVARVYQGYKERKAITRIDGVEAVEMAIYKEGDANTVAVARAVKEKLPRLRRFLPEDGQLSLVYDQSIFIENAVNEVVQAAVVGGILAFFILYFFLRNIWSTLIICVAIPVSVIATFNLMFGGDISLNIMSLGGIALGIGMLVDNAVVVLESIFRHREEGRSPLEAAQSGASEVGMAVTASTLTTIAVFFPLVFVKGIAGQLFRDQALTVTFSLLASLAVALTLIPMLASLAGKRSGHLEFAREAAESRQRGRLARGLRAVFRFVFTTVPSFLMARLLWLVRIIAKFFSLLITPLRLAFDRAYGWVSAVYPGVLDWALTHRAVVLCTAAGLFIASLMAIPYLGVELIPQLSQGEFIVEVKRPPGTPLEETDRLVVAMQAQANDQEVIRSVFSVTGTGNRLDANPEEGGENRGELRIKMLDGSTRADEERLMETLRRRFARLPGAEYKFTRPTLFSFKTPVEVEIAGHDLAGLKRLADAVMPRLEAHPRFTDVKSTMQGGYPEVQIYFDREKMATYGLQVPEVAQTVVQKVRGELATRYSLPDRKIDVLVRARERDRDSIENIRRLLVNPPHLPPIMLASVADIRVAMGAGEIQRVGQERVALVRANLAGYDLGGAAEDIRRMLATIPVPPEFDVRLAGQNAEMDVSLRSLRFALLLAIFLVYLVMASQFESLLHPFVILFTIPLALIGVVLGLLITGSTISVVVLIGVIMLAGIVVNNAIVLVDYINQRRRQGMEKLTAIREAGQVRLRPILMTTLTTILGLLPLAIGFGEGAEVRAPMAITVIGGLAVSTLLTLVVIPVVYSIVDRKA